MSRTKGSENKNKQALLLLLEGRYPGYHPIIEMAGIANDKDIDITLRANMHKEIAQYIVPKRKAVEISGDINNPIEIITHLSDEQISNKVAELLSYWSATAEKRLIC